jgi:DNA-binding MarR family transcriptional regulator
MNHANSTAMETGLRYLALGYQLRRLVDDAMTVGGLSLARTKVLQVLDQRGVMRQATLAHELGQAPRTVTQTIEALERDGFVERAADPGDGRSKLVGVTPRGVAALTASTAVGDRALQDAFGEFRPEQLETLNDLLQMLAAGLAT